MFVLDFSGLARAACGAVLACALLATAASAQGAAGGVAGLWIDHTGQGAVEIQPCGDNMCGRVVWLKNPNKKSKSGKPICGSQILGDLKRRPNNAWEAGWIYNPEDEERFSAEIKLKGADTLLVTGYLGVKWLGETFTWKRASGNLERCASDRAT